MYSNESHYHYMNHKSRVIYYVYCDYGYWYDTGESLTPLDQEILASESHEPTQKHLQESYEIGCLFAVFCSQKVVRG